MNCTIVLNAEAQRAAEVAEKTNAVAVILFVQNLSSPKTLNMRGPAGIIVALAEELF